MIADGLYHRDIYIPKVKFSDKNYPVSYGKHALEAAETDRYGLIKLPKTVNMINVQIIEIEIKYSRIEKVLIRMPYNNHLDLCMVIIPDRFFVKTVWLNAHDDKHKTLDESKYNKRPA